MPGDPIAERNIAEAYETIGRIIVEFGLLEARVVGAILHHNDPVAAFPTGPLDQAFNQRWAKWEAICEPACVPGSTAAFSELIRDVCELSKLRNDLDHCVIWVKSVPPDSFTVATHRLPSTKWTTQFDKWRKDLEKWDGTGDQPRPPVGSAETAIHRKDRLSAALDQLRRHRSKVDEISRAVTAGVPF